MEKPPAPTLLESAPVLSNLTDLPSPPVSWLEAKVKPKVVHARYPFRGKPLLWMTCAFGSLGDALFGYDQGRVLFSSYYIGGCPVDAGSQVLLPDCWSIRCFLRNSLRTTEVPRGRVTTSTHPSQASSSRVCRSRPPLAPSSLAMLAT